MPIKHTVEYEVFTFADVMADENLRKKVLEKNRYINVEYFNWWQWTKEDFHSILKTIGFWDIESQFSGFWSQGDGASFSGRYSYEKGCLEKIIKEYPTEGKIHRIVADIVRLQKTVGYKYRCTIKSRGRYCHENTMETYEDFDYPSSEFYDKLSALEDEFLDLFRDLARWYYKRLEDESDYLTSDKAVLETLESNEYEFNEDGSIF